MSHLWKSGINPGLHPRVEKMNRSLGIDSRLWREDIQGSKAHVAMLIQAQLVSHDEGQNLLSALEEIEAEIDQGRLQPLSEDEDIHSWIERELTQRLGKKGSNVHIARSRNEQVLVDVKLYLRSEVGKTIQGLNATIASLRELEKASESHLIPSYTHLRRAQPIYLKEYWEAHRIYAEESQKGFRWVLDQLNEECPMGAGAIHGTTLPTYPELEAKSLGFKHPPRNSLATLSSRRFILEYLSQCTHWLLDLSRFMEDLILFSTDEFHFLSFHPQVTTGSSMMPQKRNPDLCELIRGKSATVMGHYIAVMTLVKGLPMGYMKDLQEDKTHLFSAVDVMTDVLETLPILLGSIELHPEPMALACSDPQLLATDAMEDLVLGGAPLREAHHQIADSFKSILNQTPEALSQQAKQSCEKRYQGIQQALMRNQTRDSL